MYMQEPFTSTGRTLCNNLLEVGFSLSSPALAAHELHFCNHGCVGIFAGGNDPGRRPEQLARRCDDTRVETDLACTLTRFTWPRFASFRIPVYAQFCTCDPCYIWCEDLAMPCLTSRPRTGPLCAEQPVFSGPTDGTVSFALEICLCMPPKVP